MEKEMVFCIENPSSIAQSSTATSSSLFNLEQHFECRICQEEDDSPNLEVPCSCTGSLKFAHRKCVQRWCNEKGNTTCEICYQPFRHGYTAPQPAQADDISINIRESWGLPGAVMNLADSRLLAIAAAERQFLEDELVEFTASNTSITACCQFSVLTLLALLLLRHVLKITNVEQEEDVVTFFILFLMRVVGFLLTCYLMVRAMNSIQCRRQRHVSF